MLQVPPPAHEGFAATPGARLWYWDTGGPGEPLVLCHPASQSCQIWEYQKPALVAAGYRVIAYSRRGFHPSEPGESANPGTEVGDLEALFASLKLERAHVLGAAAGGGVAMRFAAKNPTCVRALVLAGSIVSPAEPEWQELYERLEIAAVRDVVSTAFIELGPTYRASQPAGTARFAELSALARPHGAARQPSGFELTWQAMAATRVPVFLVTGEADLYAPPPLQRLLAAHLPMAELATLRSVGHAPYWEAPADFNALVLNFLERHRSR